jgi:PAS domain S-box-containing protein
LLNSRDHSVDPEDGASVSILGQPEKVLPLGRLPAGFVAPSMKRAVGLDYVLLLGALAALYVGAAKLGIAVSVAHGVITPVWAPTGIALAGVLLFGRRVWPAVTLGAFIANATSGASLAEAGAISVGNTLEAVAGAALLSSVGFRTALDRVRDVLALVFFGAIVSTTISATNGVTVLWISGGIPGSSLGSEWLLWWSGDAMGDLIVAPLLLVWATSPLAKLSRERMLEGVALFVLLLALSALVFLGGLWRYPHLLFPLLVWAPLRFRQPGAVTASFVVAAIAIAGAVNGTTPVSQGNATVVVQVLEGLMAAVAVTLLILGAVLAERGLAEQELDRAHAALADAQEVARIGSWEWSIATNQVTWSDELYRLYGLAAQSLEVTFESFLERVHPEDRENVTRIVERAQADTRPFAVDYRTMLPDGGVRWLHGRGRVITDARGAPVRMVGTAQDITDRKRLDDLRDNILSAVSHELRTPLTSIIGFSLTLRDKGTRLGEVTRAEMVTHVAEEAGRLDRLLSDLLDLDRLRHGFTRPTVRATDVGRLAAQVAADYAADGHPVNVRADPVMAEVDAPKVERMVANLLANAVKHTPAGTEICIRVEAHGDGVLIAVDDRGPGVPEKHRRAIFDVFNRGDASHARGTGVGLSLVAQFAALHGGRVWVEDNPGGGASFRVLLPAQGPA